MLCPAGFRAHEKAGLVLSGGFVFLGVGTIGFLEMRKPPTRKEGCEWLWFLCFFEVFLVSSLFFFVAHSLSFVVLSQFDCV